MSTVTRGTRGTAEHLQGCAWVEAAPFRAHLRHLMAVSSLSSSAIALLAGLSPGFAFRLLHGRDGRPLRRISPESARQLLRITTAEARAVRCRSVPAATTQQQLRRLRELGHSVEELAELLEVSRSAVAELLAAEAGLLTAEAGLCPQLLALRVAAELSLLHTPLPGPVTDVRDTTRATVRAAA